MRNVIVPVYQPIVCMKTNEVEFCEALARRATGEGDYARLLSLGESYGFIHLVDIEMLRQVTKLLAASPELRISVNISVLTIDTALGEYLSVVYRNMHVAPRLIFEITETISIRNLRNVLLFEEAVRLLGAKVALDDVGDGFATMDLVSEVRPDFVKLPASAFARYGDSVSAFSKVRENITRLGAVIVVEHVDTLARVAILRAAGIQLGQGFFFSIPTESPLLPGTPLLLERASA